MITGVSLWEAVIIIIVGIIIWAVSRYFPAGIDRAAYYIGILVAVIGVILLLFAIIS